MSDNSTPTYAYPQPGEPQQVVLGPDDRIEYLDGDGRWQRLDRMEPGVRYVVRSVRGRTIGAQS